MSRKISEFNSSTTLLNSDIIPFVDLTEATVVNKNKNITFVNLKKQVLNPDTFNVFLNGSVSDKEYSLVLNTPYSFKILGCTAVLASGSCNIYLNSFTSQTISINNAITTVNFNPILNVTIAQNLVLTVANGNFPIDLSITLLIERV